MFEYYELNAIPIILKRFKVSKIILCGLSNNQTIHQIFQYCEECSAEYIAIDSRNNFEKEFINDYPLNVLPTLNNYDAIFLNDDPNWFTVFHELKLIKENNDLFPLVFICHNIFPHKYQDSYIDPDIIPLEYINEYSSELNFNGININDGFYHSVEKNTPKNGVSAAIEDFLNEFSDVSLMNFKLDNGITILFPNNSISQIRLGVLSEELEDCSSDVIYSYDYIVENKLLINHILDNAENVELNELLAEKEEEINNYSNTISLNNEMLNYKNSQIENFNSKLNLKDSQIKNLESKLFNRENEIVRLNDTIKNNVEYINSLERDMEYKEIQFNDMEHKLNSKLNFANSENDSLKLDISQIKQIESQLNNQVEKDILLINDKDNEIHLKENQINSLQIKLNERERRINSIKKQCVNHLSKLNNNEYCISCFKEEITNNSLEIQYLKKHSILKSFFSPFAYIYLFLKSNPRELLINFKLYNSLKRSKCFDIGYYLNNNKDLQNSNWCNYFSPELHYVCKGFDEKRKFNKKYFNRNSKKELLEYILNCN